MYIYARACFTGRLSSFHGPRPRLVSPRRATMAAAAAAAAAATAAPRRMKVERRRRERGVNPHERYHRNGTARVVMCSHRRRPTTPVPAGRARSIQPFDSIIPTPDPICTRSIRVHLDLRRCVLSYYTKPSRAISTKMEEIYNLI